MARPKTRGELKALNVNIDINIANAVDEASKKSGISKTVLVEKALSEYIKKHNKEFESLK